MVRKRRRKHPPSLVRLQPLPIHLISVKNAVLAVRNPRVDINDQHLAAERGRPGLVLGDIKHIPVSIFVLRSSDGVLNRVIEPRNGVSERGLLAGASGAEPGVWWFSEFVGRACRGRRWTCSWVADVALSLRFLNVWIGVEP